MSDTLATDWYTDFDQNSTEWKHVINSPKVDMKFSIFLNNTGESEFKEFMDKYMSFLDEEIRERLTENFLVTKKLLDKKNDNPSYLANLLPGVQKEVKHPVSGEMDKLFSIIINLNDHHKWERDAVADWIESLDEVPVFQAESVDRKSIEVVSHVVKS